MTGLQLSLIYFQMACSCINASCFNEYYSKSMALLECPVSVYATQGESKDRVILEATKNLEQCIEKFK